jgi:glycosyltransferase involved in cell wall biosynthesis
MNILHICSSSTGGAGMAAARLSLAQQNKGDLSHVVTVQEIDRNKNNLHLKLQRKTISALQGATTNKKYGVVTPLSLAYLKEDYVADFKPDVIHIHNWYNILNYRVIYRLSKKYPIVFTMHDERLITGGCHNSLNCKQFDRECIKCPANHVLRKSVANDYQIKKQFFKQLERYSIVTPSEWMMNRAINSGIFINAKRIEKISNIVSVNLAEPIKDPEIEKRLITKILFVAADINVKLKGFSLLEAAMLLLTEKNPHVKYVLTAVGSSENKTINLKDNYKVNYKKPLSQYELQKLLAESSILVVPSLTENAPNIIVEAQLSGVIVLASEVGGIPEMIKDEKTGFLSNCDSLEIYKKLEYINSLGKERLERITLAAKEFALMNYSPSEVYEQHRAVYEITNRHQA